MSTHSHALEPELGRYLRDWALAGEDAVLAELRERTAPLEMARMQISPEQGQFLHQLVNSLRASRALELGVFTGYSSICVARALCPGGQLIALDVSEEWTTIAREFWAKAGIGERVQLRLAPAQESLEALLADGQRGSFDFAFVDADKEGYAAYYESCLELLRPGGIMAFDNAFMGGAVVNPGPNDPGGRALSELNRKAQEDARVEAALLPIGDGLLLATKR